MSMARAELDTVQRRRDGIVGQLAALRDLMASFGVDQPQAGSSTGSTEQSGIDEQSGGGGEALPAPPQASSPLSQPAPEERSEQGGERSAPANGNGSEPEADQTQVLAPARSQD
jgi:hypothetical protein